MTEITVAVLGGGVLGLTVALRLQETGLQVSLFEAESLPGGLAAGFQISTSSESTGESQDDPRYVWLEKFYHHLFKSDTAIISLVKELGLESALVWRRPLTVTLRGGSVYQLDSPLSLLRFGPLPIVDRIRMGIALAYLRLLPSPAPLEGSTAVDWIHRVMGKRAYQIVWEPLLKGKFGVVADEIALPWFWARVHDRTPELGYIRGGFQRFYTRLEEKIKSSGGQVNLRSRIRKVERRGNKWVVTYYQADSRQDVEEAVDLVVSTLPTKLTCHLISGLPAAYAEQFGWGRAYSAHCLILSLDRPLTRSYWMNINDPGYPFMVLVEHTNYMPCEDYNGRHLVYLGNYRPHDDPLLLASKDEVLSTFVPHLTRINPEFRLSWIKEAWMFSAPFAQPIVSKEYKAHIPPFDTPLEGLYVGNMFQVYPHDRGQNYSVELGERLAKHIVKRHMPSSGRSGTSLRPAFEYTQTYRRTVSE